MKVGEFELSIVSDGLFALDGGAMFGTVPKVIWEKLWPADEKNRIDLGLNALLIQGRGEKILVDCGIGGKFEPKHMERFKIRRNPDLITSLVRQGIKLSEITIQILTHLHFDHIGGGTYFVASAEEEGSRAPASGSYFDGNRIALPTFTNAKREVRRIVQFAEWVAAVNPDPRSKASYLPENFLPYVGEGLEFVNGTTEIIPGVHVIQTAGHTPGHQIVVVESGGEIAVYWADLIPTRKHLKIPYVMGYDTHPLTTMREKERILNAVSSKRALFIFEHDPDFPAAWYERKGGEWQLVEWVY